MRRIYSTWWPLAASWLMMGLELPVVSAVIARLDDPTIHLAAYGGVVFPLSILIEGPIIMLLAASAALCKDRDSYRKLRRFMYWSGGILGLIHIVLAATPLYYIVVDVLMGIPQEVQEPARIGMLIMVLWTPCIAYRRFQQGILIRFGKSRAVGVGTAIRLCTNCLVLGVAYYSGRLPGIVVGAMAISAGVVAEAIYVAVVVRPVIRGPLREASPPPIPLSTRRLFSFYLPLAVTPFFTTLAWPVVSAALSRMPRAIDSLAVLPVLNGLVFTLRSLGFAFNEVVVVKLDEPDLKRALKRFAVILGLSTSLCLLIVAATPFSRFWFSVVSGLTESLTDLGVSALLIAVLMPAFSVIQSYFQGHLVHAHETRSVTEAMAMQLVVLTLLLSLAVRFGGEIAGLYLGLFAVLGGFSVQALWFCYRARKIV